MIFTSKFDLTKKLDTFVRSVCSIVSVIKTQHYCLNRTSLHPILSVRNWRQHYINCVKMTNISGVYLNNDSKYRQSRAGCFSSVSLNLFLHMHSRDYFDFPYCHQKYEYMNLNKRYIINDIWDARGWIS